MISKKLPIYDILHKVFLDYSPDKTTYNCNNLIYESQYTIRLTILCILSLTNYSGKVITSHSSHAGELHVTGIFMQYHLVAIVLLMSYIAKQLILKVSLKSRFLIGGVQAACHLHLPGSWGALVIAPANTLPSSFLPQTNETKFSAV